MLSNLTSIITSIVGARKDDIASEVHNYELKVKDIEMKLNIDGEVYFAPAMQALRDLFGSHLDLQDYTKIEQQIRNTIGNSNL